MPLTIDQRKRLHQALLEAYPAGDELAMQLALSRGVFYYDLTAASNRKVEYLNIIVQITAEGWIAGFVADAAEDRPLNADLQALAAELAAGANPRAFDDAADARKQSALEKTVKPDQPDADAAVLLSAIEMASAAVCIIEHAGQPQGTGFLVGADLVLTNWHVAHPLLGRNPADLSVLFGLRRLANGTLTVARRQPFAADWMVASRPYDSTDEIPDPAALPDPLALDYALLRLATGDWGGPAPLTLDPATPLPLATGDLVMIQHPQGLPQKISFGRMTAIAGGGLRLRYDVNTKPGSSGSPILDHCGVLVGLHHAGDPNAGPLAAYNQGIPIGRIAADIADRLVAGGGS